MDGDSVPDDINDLRNAYNKHPQALATWVREHLGVPETTGQVLEAAVNGYLTPDQAQSLADVCHDLNKDELWALLNCLASADLWAIRHPRLAEATLRRGIEHEDRDRVLKRIARDGTEVSGVIGWENGISEQLNSARDQAAQAAQTTTEPDLIAVYQAAGERFQRDIDEIARDHRQEADDDW